MSPELHQTMRLGGWGSYRARLREHGARNAIGVQLVFLGNAVVLPEVRRVLACGHKGVLRKQLCQLLG